MSEVIEKALADHGEAINQFKGSVEEKLKALPELAEKVDKLEDSFQRFEEKGVRLRGGSSVNKSDPMAVYRKALERDAFQAFKEGTVSSTGKIELDIGLKAVTSLQGSTTAEGIDVRPVQVAPVLGIQRPLSLLDILPVVEVGTNAIEAPVFDEASLSSSGYQEGEGFGKPEGTFDMIWEKFPVATVAQHVTVSKQLLEDMPMLMATIDRLMKYDLARQIEEEILKGDGLANHVKGLLTYATPYASTAALGPADRIGEAAAAMEDLGLSPSVAVLRGTELFNIQSERDTNGQYVASGWAGPVDNTLWGKRAVKSAAMPVNTGLVLDLGWITVMARSKPTITISGSHGTNFTQNLITILCEARFGLYVAKASAIGEVELTTPAP